MNVIYVGDIVEENGKTVRENNLNTKHAIPIGSLVEIEAEEWYGDGACVIYRARLWVVEHNRDCDGTPLYTISPSHPDHLIDGAIVMDGHFVRDELSVSILNNFKSGFSESSLKVIEVTDEVKKGVGALSWEDSI